MSWRQGRQYLCSRAGFPLFLFYGFFPETMLVWNGTGFALLGIPGMSGGPLTLAALAPNTELCSFLPDPFVSSPRLDWQTGVERFFSSLRLDWRTGVERLSILCVLVGTSMAISKVYTFGWRLCQRFGKIAWNKDGVLWVTVLLSREPNSPPPQGCLGSLTVVARTGDVGKEKLHHFHATWQSQLSDHLV